MRKTRSVAVFTAILFLVAFFCGCSTSVPRTRASAAPTAKRWGSTLSGLGAGAVEIGGKTYLPKEDAVNVLLIGVDKDSTRSGPGRADMLVLCTLDEKMGEISLLTIPRDTHAWVYHVDDNGAITDSVYEKINHSYAYGMGPQKYSAENAMQCVSRLLGCDGQLNVPIEYYISMDLDGLADLAAAFGGIEVVLDQDVPNVGAEGETVRLEGPTVRYYLENRHDMSDGEVSRQIHEQTFLHALMTAIAEKGGSQAASELYAVFMRFMRMNLTAPQFIHCIRLLDNDPAIMFNRVTGTGTTIDGIWYLEPDQQQMRDLVLNQLYRER